MQSPAVHPALRNFPRVTLPGLEPRTEATDLIDAEKAARTARVALSMRCIKSLRTTGRHIYTGTVPAKVKKARRKSDRFAALSRKANR